MKKQMRKRGVKDYRRKLLKSLWGQKEISSEEASEESDEDFEDSIDKEVGSKEEASIPSS